MLWPSTRSVRRLFGPTRPTRPIRTRNAFRPRLQLLEDRNAPAILTVTSFLDAAPAVDGKVTLREAIQSINAGAPVNGDVTNSGGAYGTGDTINFAIGAVGSTQTINLTSAMNPLTKAVVLNGLSQGPAGNTTPFIVLNGSGLSGTVDGLTLNAQGTTVEGLVIQNFSGNGLVLNANSNTVVSNYIGTNSTGTAKAPNANAGILVNNVANNVIGGVDAGDGNVISGNGFGVVVSGNAAATVIQGNVIGLGTDGSALGNTNIGVVFLGGAHQNSVGGTTAAARNVISGSIEGVAILGTGTRFNAVDGNFIGTDKAGAAARGNTYGVVIGVGATANYVGTNAANVISGNTYAGVDLSDAGTAQNYIYANLIGTDATGTVAVPNGYFGVLLGFGAGGDPATSGTQNYVYNNTVSGNLWGVAEFGPAHDNWIGYNRIGTDQAGTSALGNKFYGVLLRAGATNTTVYGNTISSNGYGVVLADAGTDHNTVDANRIGTDTTGAKNLGNFVGVVIMGGASHNQIGAKYDPATATYSGVGNHIDHSVAQAIAVADMASVGNTILSNSIDENGYFVGIDLGADGPTANGANPRAMPNNGQNMPVITSITGPSVSFSLDSTRDTTFLVQFFSSPASHPGQGETLIGSTTVTTDATGHVEQVKLLSTIPADAVVTATATNLTTGDTSEFSV